MVLLVFIVIIYLIFDNLVIYNEFGVYYDVNFRLNGIFVECCYLFYKLSVEFRWWWDVEDGYGLVECEGKVVY